MTNDSNWGGLRKGGGRKPKYRSKSRRKNLIIPEEYEGPMRRYLEELDRKRYPDPEPEEPEYIWLDE